MGNEIDIQASAGAKPDTRVLRLNGSLNLVTVPGFLDKLRAEKTGTLIIDFSGVSMVDSAGVGSLIQTYVGFQSARRKLALVGMSQRILSVLEITRVKGLLPVYTTLQEAEEKL
jgi:anti-sigma B factor antagonist